MNERLRRTRYILLEVVWVVIALTLFCVSMLIAKRDDVKAAGFFVAALMAIGAAVGGLFGRMASGVHWTLAGLVLLALLLATAGWLLG